MPKTEQITRVVILQMVALPAAANFPVSNLVCQLNGYVFILTFWQ